MKSLCPNQPVYPICDRNKVLLILILICFDFGGLVGPICRSILCLRFVLNEKTRQYSTATNTIYIRAFHLLNGCSTIYVVVPVLVKFGFEAIYIYTVGADILSGNEFHLFITLLLKQCCRIVV